MGTKANHSKAKFADDYCLLELQNDEKPGGRRAKIYLPKDYYMGGGG